jgi:hypothetical protein
MDVDMSGPTTADYITVAVAEEISGTLRPLSVDLQSGNLRIQICTRRMHAIDEVFQPDFAQAIRDICLNVAADAQLVNEPDFRVWIHGLGIEGYTLFARPFEDGLRRFTIRLRRVTGNALALLKLGDAPLAARGDLPCGIGGHVGVDRLFDEMLAHLYLPLVNLNSYLRAVLDGQRACAGEQFSVSAAQLKARTEILQFAFDRMISELMVARATDEGDAPGGGVAAAAPDARAARPPRTGNVRPRQACAG